jgi:ribosomal-protein-alanine N-acetyltransferase
VELFDAKKSLTQVIELDQKYFDWPWQQKQWHELGDKDLLLGIKDQQLLGFILLRQNYDDAHLLKLLVHPEYRRQGLAHKLLGAAIAQMDTKSIYLEVAVDNRAAIAFYESYDFKKLVKKAGFYQDGTDAWAMQRKQF